MLGHDLDRLTEAASIAAAHGLFVWFEPRQFDKDPEQTLAFLGSVAHAAERLRARYPGVGITVGTELTIFMSGLVPGNDYTERIQALALPESAGYQERLNAFLDRALKTVQPLFKGQITYCSGSWEEVDWHGFMGLAVGCAADERLRARGDVTGAGPCGSGRRSPCRGGRRRPRSPRRWRSAVRRRR